MGFGTDLRLSARALLREPGFAAICLLTLAFGIGANTAIFSVVNGVLLRPLPARDPERLMALREVIPALERTYPLLPVSAKHFTEWRGRARSFEGIAAFDFGSVNLTGQGEPERLDAARVSVNMFDTLGIRPALGRAFGGGEDAKGLERVAVISNALWRRRFHADPGLIGRTVTLDSQAHTIIGVLPAGFQFPGMSSFDVRAADSVQPDVFKPLVFTSEELSETMGNFNYSVIGRLKAGVSRQQALAELNVIAAQLVKLAGEQMELRASVIPLLDSITGGSRKGLLILPGAVGAVLLIVCVNLANLMLARAERRGHEAAIRAALGAGPGALLRHAFSETVLVCALGGALGVALAWASLGVLVRNAPSGIPRMAEVRLDGAVLLFAVAVTMATGLLFGLAPAWRASRARPHSALKGAGRTSTGTAATVRLRSVLIAAEAALSALLLVTAGLLGTSFSRVIGAEHGFRAPNVLAAEVVIPMASYSEEAQRNRFHENLLARLVTEPGVASAAITTALPLTGETWVDNAFVPGTTATAYERPAVNVRFVSSGYLRTMGIPLLSGRTFNESDRKRQVAIISERLASVLWPGQDAVGRKFQREGGQQYEVVGVCGDVRADADKRAPAMIYRPYWDWAPRKVVIVARASGGDPWMIAGSLRAALRATDPDVPVPNMRTMREVLLVSAGERRFQMALAAAFGAAALLLACLGIYGVVSYSVARRTNEIGIRVALGALPGRIYGIVLRQGITPVLAGLIVGLLAALAAGRLLSSLLYEVSARNPLTFASVALLLAVVALAACWIPARRAAHVNPLVALRYE